MSKPLAWYTASSAVIIAMAAWIVTRLDTPGRISGSKVTSEVKSVTARRILRAMSSGESVMEIVAIVWGSDLDILAEGSRRDLTFRVEPVEERNKVKKCICISK